MSLTSAYHSRGSRRRITLIMKEFERKTCTRRITLMKQLHQTAHARTHRLTRSTSACFATSPGLLLPLGPRMRCNTHTEFYILGIYLYDLDLSISVKRDAGAQAVILPQTSWPTLISAFSFRSGKSPSALSYSSTLKKTHGASQPCNCSGFDCGLNVHKTNVHLWLNGRIVQHCFTSSAA